MEIGMPKEVHEIEIIPGFEPVPSLIPVEEPEPVTEPAYAPS